MKFLKAHLFQLSVTISSMAHLNHLYFDLQSARNWPLHRSFLVVMDLGSRLDATQAPHCLGPSQLMDLADLVMRMVGTLGLIQDCRFSVYLSFIH